jgi:DNA-binding NarL/FixJ family response regulator
MTTHEPGPVITVLCVDDNPDVLEVLETILAGEPGLRCVGCAEDAETFVALATRLRPAVAIVDLSMPGRVSALDAIAEISREVLTTRVIAHSGYDDAASRDAAVEAGAWGFVSKHAAPEALIEAIRRVAGGEVCLLSG